MQKSSALYRFLRLLIVILPCSLGFFSCTSSHVRQQNTMFRLDGTAVDTSRLRRAVNRLERNYVIQPNDYLTVRVYTNDGEKILDPNGELSFGSPAGVSSPVTRSPTASGTRGSSGGQSTGGAEFLVQSNGFVRLPMINDIKLSGYSLLQADSVLKLRYQQFYIEPFVTTQVSNNRIIILGAVGGGNGQVIPLANDNMNLLEVLALAGGLDGGAITGAGSSRSGRADNIRLIRGDLKNPRVQVIDLTSFAGLRRANLQVEPNDIIYVEPIRRPFFEALSDVGPLFGLISAFASLSLTVFYIINRN